MRVVIDTNIFFSGLKGGGKPALVLDAMALAGYTLICSEDLLAELDDVISRKFSWQRTRIESTLNRIRITSEMVTPEFVLTDCADPDDNRILEAAVEGRADCSQRRQAFASDAPLSRNRDTDCKRIPDTNGCRQT
jgi:uncharacterized protein